MDSGSAVPTSKAQVSRERPPVTNKLLSFPPLDPFTPGFGEEKRTNGTGTLVVRLKDRFNAYDAVNLRRVVGGGRRN